MTIYKNLMTKKETTNKKVALKWLQLGYKVGKYEKKIIFGG